MLLCFPPTTPYVVTKVITSDFLFFCRHPKQPHPLPQLHLIAVSYAILVCTEFHFAQVDNSVCPLDYHVNLKTGYPFFRVGFAPPCGYAARIHVVTPPSVILGVVGFNKLVIEQRIEIRKPENVVTDFAAIL